MRGVRETCYFCSATWGSCSCSFPEGADAPGFDFEGTWITAPNVSECGRFFVDPVAYYGAAYAAFAGRM